MCCRIKGVIVAAVGDVFIELFLHFKLLLQCLFFRHNRGEIGHQGLKMLDLDHDHHHRPGSTLCLHPPPPPPPLLFIHHRYHVGSYSVDVLYEIQSTCVEFAELTICVTAEQKLTDSIYSGSVGYWSETTHESRLTVAGID